MLRDRTFAAPRSLHDAAACRYRFDPPLNLAATQQLTVEFTEAGLLRPSQSCHVVNLEPLTQGGGSNAALVGDIFLCAWCLAYAGWLFRRLRYKRAPQRFRALDVNPHGGILAYHGLIVVVVLLGLALRAPLVIELEWTLPDSHIFDAGAPWPPPVLPRLNSLLQLEYHSRALLCVAFILAMGRMSLYVSLTSLGAIASTTSSGGEGISNSLVSQPPRRPTLPAHTLTLAHPLFCAARALVGEGHERLALLRDALRAADGHHGHRAPPRAGGHAARTHAPAHHHLLRPRPHASLAPRARSACSSSSCSSRSRSSATSSSAPPPPAGAASAPRCARCCP
jgi:hypothetical protein